MKIENMLSPQGNPVPNQFIITDGNKTKFQSYDSIIAVKEEGKKTIIGKDWDYSVTTGKYRNLFLGETKAETQKKIDNGTYIYNGDL
jgi:hypothetical protein